MGSDRELIIINWNEKIATTFNVCYLKQVPLVYVHKRKNAVICSFIKLAEIHQELLS